MSTPWQPDLVVAPHLAVRASAGGLLEVRVRGPIDVATFRRTLGDPRLSALVHSRRPSAARLLITTPGVLTLDDVTSYAEGFWAHDLREAGCGAPSVAFEDTALPVVRLRAPGWPLAPHAVARRLCEGADAPLVSLALSVAGGAAPYPLLAEQPWSAREEALLERALAAVVLGDETFELASDPQVPRYAICRAPSAADWLPSPAAHAQLGRLLGGTRFAVGVPARGQVMAVTMPSQPSKEVRALERVVAAAHARAGADAISPSLFVLDGGRFVGVVPREAPAPISLSFGAPVLRARCSAEAHLYLYLQGVGPERTISESKDKEGRPLLTLSGVDRAGRTVSHTFSVAEPDGQLGAGGVREPSTILPPARLLEHADYLSKSVPAQLDRLDPEARARAKAVLNMAAICLEEIVKLIPPGASAVPESAFHGAEARAVYEREPGRFRGARLEVVAQTYRKLAERG